MRTADISVYCCPNLYTYLLIYVYICTHTHIHIYASKNADLHIQGKMFTFELEDEKYLHKTCPKLLIAFPHSLLFVGYTRGSDLQDREREDSRVTNSSKVCFSKILELRSFYTRSSVHFLRVFLNS